MSKTVLNVRTDKVIKDEARRVAKEMGLPLSAIVNAFLAEFIRNREVTFIARPTPRQEIAKILEQASEDFRRGRNVSKEFSSASAATKFLDEV